MTNTVAIQRTCTCGRAYTVTPAQDRTGHGRQCPACTKAKKPVRSSRPLPVSPRADDLPLMDGGSMVRCSGPCGQMRPRGEMCRACEWRAFEVAS